MLMTSSGKMAKRSPSVLHTTIAPLTLEEIAAKSPTTGGPIAGHNEVVADGAGVSFASHICDVEVDPMTGATKIVRYTVIGTPVEPFIRIMWKVNSKVVPRRALAGR